MFGRRWVLLVETTKRRPGHPPRNYTYRIRWPRYPKKPFVLYLSNQVAQVAMGIFKGIPGPCFHLSSLLTKSPSKTCYTPRRKVTPKFLGDCFCIVVDKDKQQDNNTGFKQLFLFIPKTKMNCPGWLLKEVGSSNGLLNPNISQGSWKKCYPFWGDRSWCKRCWYFILEAFSWKKNRV